MMYTLKIKRTLFQRSVAKSYYAIFLRFEMNFISTPLLSILKTRDLSMLSRQFFQNFNFKVKYLNIFKKKKILINYVGIVSFKWTIYYCAICKQI